MSDVTVSSTKNVIIQPSSDQQTVLNSATVPSDVDIKITNTDSTSKAVFDMNNAFSISENIYNRVLSPQLEKNEDLKREQKKDLMKNLFNILQVQFIFTYICVVIILMGVFLSQLLGLSENVILSVISFIKFYITSIVVELLSILFFIVKNVFDTSIVELIKDFDKRQSNEHSKTKDTE